MSAAEWAGLGLFFAMGFAVMAAILGGIKLFDWLSWRRQQRKIRAHNQPVMARHLYMQARSTPYLEAGEGVYKLGVSTMFADELRKSIRIGGGEPQFEEETRRYLRRSSSGQPFIDEHKVKNCKHVNVVDVDLALTGEIVDHLCTDCGKQLGENWQPPPGPLPIPMMLDPRLFRDD